MAEEAAVLNVGTRESQLARVQTDHVVAQLQKYHSNLRFNVIGISTKGDKILDKPLPKIGDKGLFTKELEVALADGRVDLVVHSLKDLPSTMPEGMVIGCISKREDRRDALVMSEQNQDKTQLGQLPDGSVIGTSSLRRIAQLSAKHEHLKFEDVRGNLNTRLRKLDADDGKYDALVLAAAGLGRLGWHNRISMQFDAADMMYAAGQGALAVEVRQSDSRALSVVEQLIDPETLLECVAERSFLQKLGGGCSVPIGVRCSITKGDDSSDVISLAGAVHSLDGRIAKVGESSMKLSHGDPEGCATVFTGVYIPPALRADAAIAAQVGCFVAESLLAQGADKVLQEARAAIGPGK